MDFEDVRLCDLLDKIEKKAQEIVDGRQLSEFKSLGVAVQSVYDFFVTSQKSYTGIQPMLKNLFSSFNYGAVIINDALKNKKLDREGAELLNECLQIIIGCCRNIRSQLNK